MNYLRLAIALLFALTTQCSFADSIPTFQITDVEMFMGPNFGDGDNVTFMFTGPGVAISGYGGMACSDWCSFPIPDPNIAFTSQIFVSAFGTAIFGGKGYDADSLFIENLFDGSGGLNATASGDVAGNDTVLFFNLLLPTSGGWGLNFVPTLDDNGNPAFSFTDGSFRATAPVLTPEPTTLALVLTGIVGIAGVVKTKVKLRH